MDVPADRSELQCACKGTIIAMAQTFVGSNNVGDPSFELLLVSMC